MSARKLRTEQNNRPDIFRYHDYRAFLKDWLDYLKSSQSDFSIRILSARAGIAVGYLNMVLKNSRNLSEKALHKMLPFLEMKEAESKYLSALLKLSDSKLQDTRLAALKDMQVLHLSTDRSKELEVHRYLSKWYYVAIREMANLPDFKLDPSWISVRLQKPVPIKEIAEAIEFLKSANFIQEMVDGSVKQTEKQLDCFSGIYRLSLAEYHKQMFTLAAESIDTVPREERNILGHTFAIDEKNFGEVKKLLEDLQKRLSELEKSETKPSRVYHVGLLAFPLTKKPGAKDE